MCNNIFNIPKDYITRYSYEEYELPQYRNEFMRDRDRLLYCTAFKRLAGKTQIYTIGDDDHKKNRLTHSLEVAQIARTISGALGLNTDLAESIAIGHDFGHTPFGHAGEEMLHDIMIPGSTKNKRSPFIADMETITKIIEREESELAKTYNCDNLFGFKHNIQSVRTAVLIEDCYRDDEGNNKGLNLTNYTLWGIMNHSSISYRDRDKSFPNYQNSFSRHISIKDREKGAWSLEAYVVRLADDIAQWHHDFEDAVRSGAMSFSKICEIINETLYTIMGEKDRDKMIKLSSINRVDRNSIAALSHIVVNTLVTDSIIKSRDNMIKIGVEMNEIYNKSDDGEKSKIVYSEYDTLRLSIKRDEIISLSDTRIKDRLRSTIGSYVHHSMDVERMNGKGRYIIKKLFAAYLTSPQQLPDGQIVHFMVDIGKYKNIDEAYDDGIGEVRIKFEKIMDNPKMIEKAILMRRICDHIASMTDRYAIDEYRALYQ